MQSVHGTGEPGLDAIKVTNWNLANKVVTLAYFQGKITFSGIASLKSKVTIKGLQVTQKGNKKLTNHVIIFYVS